MPFGSFVTRASVRYKSLPTDNPLPNEVMFARSNLKSVPTVKLSGSVLSCAVPISHNPPPTVKFLPNSLIGVCDSDILLVTVKLLPIDLIGVFD